MGKEGPPVVSKINLSPFYTKINLSPFYLNVDTLTGFGKGFTEEMATAGLATLDSAANLMAHPDEAFAAMNEFILTADAQQILGDRYDQVKAQLASVDDALAQGGDVHSEKLGQQMGGLLAVFVTLVVGTEASAAKGASVLSKAGIDVSSSSYKVIAADATADSIRGRVDQLTAFGQEAKSPATWSGGLLDNEVGFSSLPQKGSLRGEPELPPKNASPEMVRSIDRQNEAALKLSKAGYDVEQLPNVKKNQANPDLKINGELADVASPITGSTYSIWRTINDKVTSQAKNVVLNLADSPLGFEEIAKALNEYPVPGLQRLYLLKNGEFKVFEGGK